MLKIKEIDVQKLPISKIVIIGLLLVCIFSIRQCSLNELSLSNKGLEIKMYQNSQQAFEAKKNELNQELATQNLNLLEKSKAVETLLLRNSELKSLVTQVRSKNETLIKDQMAHFTSNDKDNVVVVERPDPNDTTNTKTETVEAIKVGTKFTLVDTGNWYSLGGEVKRNGILLDSIKVRNEFTVNIGEKKVKGIKGIFGKTEPVVEIRNNNPYTSTKEMYNIQFKPKPKKWYQTKVAAVGAGLVAGLLAPILLPIIIK